MKSVKYAYGQSKTILVRCGPKRCADNNDIAKYALGPIGHVNGKTISLLVTTLVGHKRQKRIYRVPKQRPTVQPDTELSLFFNISSVLIYVLYWSHFTRPFYNYRTLRNLTVIYCNRGKTKTTFPDEFCSSEIIRDCYRLHKIYFVYLISIGRFTTMIFLRMILNI